MHTKTLLKMDYIEPTIIKYEIEPYDDSDKRKNNDSEYNID